MHVVPTAATLALAKPATMFSLNVRLPKSVALELGQTSFEERTTLVQMLGRLLCSGSTKD